MHGPVMIDVEGLHLTAEERELLQHPAVGGVVLFARNYASTAQLCALVASIHGARPVPLVVAVDQEGGRVQRFLEGFTRIPAMGRIGALDDEGAALALAYAAGVVIGVELSRCGIDLTFAPVLDLDLVRSDVIGARAFSADPRRVASLGQRLAAGLRAAGLPAVGKHFPGHGSVAVDSHLDVPLDDRSLEAIAARDLVPFARCIEGGLGGVMSAHVLFPQVAKTPATFSHRWLDEVLRESLGFTGLLFTDDLSMGAARHVASVPVERVRMAREAGCDVVLVCNDRPAVEAVLDALDATVSDTFRARAARFWKDAGGIVADAEYQQARTVLAGLDGAAP